MNLIWPMDLGSLQFLPLCTKVRARNERPRMAVLVSFINPMRSSNSRLCVPTLSSPFNLFAAIKIGSYSQWH